MSNLTQYTRLLRYPLYPCCSVPRPSSTITPQSTRPPSQALRTRRHFTNASPKSTNLFQRDYWNRLSSSINVSKLTHIKHFGVISPIATYSTDSSNKPPKSTPASKDPEPTSTTKPTKESKPEKQVPSTKKTISTSLLTSSPQPPVTLSSSKSQALTATIKCTEFDNQGNVKKTAVDITKLHFIDTYHLNTRDLRKLDGSFKSQHPAILVRPASGVILVNLGDVRALICHDKVLLCDPITMEQNEASKWSKFVFDLQGALQSNGNPLPYELRALETILQHVLFCFTSKLETLYPKLDNTLRTLQKTTTTITKDLLTELLQQARDMSEFLSKVEANQRAMHDVLNSDEDLAGMFLTEAATKAALRAIDNHEESELLLETYLRQTEEIATQCRQLLSAKKSTEDILAIALDYQRNSLLVMDVKIAVGTLGVASGSFVASCFGMNLINGLEAWNHPAVFWSVVGAAVVLSWAVVWRFAKRMTDLVRYSTDEL